MTMDFQDDDELNISFKKKKTKNNSKANKRTTNALEVEQNDNDIVGGVVESKVNDGKIDDNVALKRTIDDVDSTGKINSKMIEAMVQAKKHKSANTDPDGSNILTLFEVDEAENAKRNAADNNDIVMIEKTKSRYAAVSQKTSIRSTTVMDFQPDICKDYKETGYCGWGDTCKFIHDRGDYSNFTARKTWKEQMSSQDGFKKGLGSSLSNNSNSTEDKKSTSSTQDYNNYKCFICLHPLTIAGEIQTEKSPVNTNCQHIFCESCLLQKLRLSSKCPQCKKETNSTCVDAKPLLLRNIQIQEQREKDNEEKILA